jgi:hypothetical protein
VEAAVEAVMHNRAFQAQVAVADVLVTIIQPAVQAVTEL